MRAKSALIIALFAATLGLSSWNLCAQSEAEIQQGYRDGQLILKLSSDLSLNEQRAFLSARGLEVLYHYPRILAWFVSCSQGKSAPERMAVLQKNRLVRWVQLNNFGRRTQTFPGDASFGNSWGLHNTGQNVNGDPGSNDDDMDCPEAWDLITDASSVITAIVDSGANLTHQDLSANIWQNPNEIPGNGVDDDGNGFIDDVNGWDFLGNDNSPTDLDGHGTNVTGTACARGGNGVGSCGVCWQANVMVLKDGNAVPQVALSAMAFEYAAMNGAVVANFSTGYGGASQPVMQAAVNVAQNAGMIICVAAGNSSTNLNTTTDVPATYTNNNLIVAAATNNNDGLASFSSFGNIHTDLGAPGVTVFTTSRTNNQSYAFVDGTSFAAPMTTGCVALMRAYNPTASYTAVRAALINNCDFQSGLNGLVASNGRINLFAALNALGSGGVPAPVADFGSDLTSGPAPLSVNFVDQSSGSVTSWNWNFGDGQISTSQNPAHVYANPGSFFVILSVSGPGGADSEVKTNYITVAPPLPPGINDGSFEGQTANAAPQSPWTNLIGTANLIEPAAGIGADLGFPSEGSQWCHLDGTGSDSATPPGSTAGFGAASSGASGISQTFMTNDGSGVLSLDVAFLNREAANQATFNDFMCVEVEALGNNYVAFFADTFSATPSTSIIGSLASTNLESLTIDLGALFPAASGATTFVLRILVGNVGDGTFPSGAYIDRVELNELSLEYPGTMGDYRLRTALDGASLTGGPGEDVKQVVPGNVITIALDSPGGSLMFQPYSLLATGVGHTQGFRIPEIIFGGAAGPLPGLYADGNTIAPVGGENYSGGVPPLLPAGGEQFFFTWPTNFNGADILLQAVLHSGLAQNGFFETSNGHVLEEL